MTQFAQPVAMRVTHKQWKRDLKKPLNALGYNWGSFNTPKEDLKGGYPILHTNYFGKNRQIGGCNSLSDGTYLIDHYNPELFLAIAGMTEGDDWVVGDWLITQNMILVPDNNNILFQCESLDASSFEDNQAENGCHNYRKATLEELVAHFTDNPIETREFDLEANDNEVKIQFHKDGKVVTEVIREEGNTIVNVRIIEG